MPYLPPSKRRSLLNKLRAPADNTAALPQEGALHDRTFDPQPIAAPTTAGYRLAGALSRALSTPTATAARMSPGAGDVLDAGASVVESAANIFRGAPVGQEAAYGAIGALPFMSGSLAHGGGDFLSRLFRSGAPESILRQTIKDRAAFLRDIGEHRASDELLGFAGDNAHLTTPVVHGTPRFEGDIPNLSLSRDIGMHVGTPEQAGVRANLGAYMVGEDNAAPQLLPLVLREGPRPLTVPDLGNWDSRAWREEALRVGSTIPGRMADDLVRLDNRVARGASPDTPATVRNVLLDHGVTSVLYKNTAEGRGMSAIALDPSSLKGLMSRRFTIGKPGLFTGLLAAAGAGAAADAYEDGQPAGLLAGGRR